MLLELECSQRTCLAHAQRLGIVQVVHPGRLNRGVLLRVDGLQAYIGPFKQLSIEHSDSSSYKTKGHEVSVASIRITRTKNHGRWRAPVVAWSVKSSWKKAHSLKARPHRQHRCWCSG